MTLRIPISLIAATLALLGCKAAVTESDEPVDWKVSWQPATTHEDNTPIVGQPAYELEMQVEEAGQTSWKRVWSGTTTTANVKAPPGHRCFRAVTIENGVKSRASEAICATKEADNGTRYAAEDAKGAG